MRRRTNRSPGEQDPRSAILSVTTALFLELSAAKLLEELLALLFWKEGRDQQREEYQQQHCNAQNRVAVGVNGPVCGAPECSDIELPLEASPLGARLLGASDKAGMFALRLRTRSFRMR